jgi:hypothetical protein
MTENKECNPENDSYCIFEKQAKDRLEYIEELEKDILKIGNQIMLEEFQREITNRRNRNAE